jgi:CDP-glucose 4,6-dehydratase
MRPGFWRGRRVFVTGHTGFKGGWLSLWLQELGAEATGYALPPPTEPSFYDMTRIAEGMHGHLADIRDLATLASALRKASPEIVFHLAAQSQVRESYRNPVETYATNVLGTVNLLEAVRRTPGVRAVIVVTSDKCYENREWLWGYRETDPMGGRDPYSNSKGCAELIASAWRCSYFAPERHAEHGVALASARAGNAIGGGDWATDRLIPDMLRAFGQGRPVSLRYPEATRPWQHVLEPLSGYLLLAEKLVEEGPAFAEAWNFGPAEGASRPVRWIADRLSQAWGAGAAWVPEPGDHPHEAHALSLDCAKSRARLRWRPRWSLEEALRRIVEWHRPAPGGVDYRMLSLGQIRDYSSDSATGD